MAPEMKVRILRGQLATRPHLALSGTLLTLLTLNACSDRRSLETGLQITDSAGVQVVTNTSPDFPADLSEDLRIGREFRSIGGVGVDEAGYLFVADKANSTIHMFSDEGEFVRSIGREGTGDGEFAPLSIPG